MTRRHYQIFALAILIGAPLLVSLLNQVLGGVVALAPQQQVQAPAAPDENTIVVDPSASLPPESQGSPPGQAMNAPQQGDASTPPPLLDTSGTAVTGSDPSAPDPAMDGAAQGYDPSPAVALPEDESGGPPRPGSEEAVIQGRS